MVCSSQADGKTLRKYYENMTIPLTFCNAWDRIMLYTNAGGIFMPFSAFREVIVCLR